MGKALLLRSSPGCMQVEKVLGERQDIFFALPQGREVQSEGIDAKVEVPAEIPLVDFLKQAFVRGGDDPKIDRNLLVASYPLDLSGLQGPQDFDLGVQGHISDFIQEGCALVGELEFADPSFRSSRKGALLMSEQLALQQGLWNGRAVDSNKRRSVATPGVVEQPRDHLLAGAIFSLNQDAARLILEDIHQRNNVGHFGVRCLGQKEIAHSEDLGSELRQN